MIIWGSRGLDLKGQPGTFFCPQCNAERDYERRKVQRFFTLYFIPLIPLEVVHESIGCRTCRQHFTLAVLQYDPRAEREQLANELNQYCQTVMGQFARMSADQGETLQRRVVGAMAAFDGSILTTEDARAIIARTDRNYGVASRILAQHLADRGREVVVKNALDVAASDGALGQDKVAAITELATTLGMSETHLRGVLAEWTPNSAGA
jgi:hypothetical protein